MSILEKSHQYVHVGALDYLSEDSISTEIVKRENGIDSCILTANDDLGINYLNKLNINDPVEVKYWYEDAPTHNTEGTAITFFTGKVMILEPILTNNGQTVKATCFGQGYWLKEMRVANKYGIILGNIEFNPLDAGSNRYSIGNTCVLDGIQVIPDLYWQYNGDPPFIGWADLYSTCIRVEVGDGSFPVPNSCGAFKFNIPTQDCNYLLTTCVLNLTALLSSIDPIYNVAVLPEYSLDNGVTWSSFSNAYNIFEFNSLISDRKELDIITDIDTYDKLSKMSIRLRVNGYSGTGGTTTLYLSWMYIAASSMNNTSTGVTIRDILYGCKYNTGLITEYVDHVLKDITKGDGSTLSTGYSVLDTKYVFGYLDNILLGVIKFPYQDALIAINDLVKYGNAARYIDNPDPATTGLHWMVDTNGNLLLAPVGEHHLQGANGYWIDEIWADTWTDNETIRPIIVRQDMISEAFKTEIPVANLVLVAGKYEYPMNNAWCQRKEGWYATNCSISLSSDALKGPTSIKAISPSGNYDISRGINIDFTKLITPNSTVTIHFNVKNSGGNMLLALYDINLNVALYTIYYETDEWVTNDIVISMTDINQTSKQFAYYDWFHPYKNYFDWSQVATFRIVNAGSNTNFIIDDFFVSGNVIKGSMDSTNIELYGCRILTVKDSIAMTDTLDEEDTTTPLARLALYELLRNKCVRTTGKIMIPLDLAINWAITGYLKNYIMQGQRVRLITDKWTAPTGKDFRILSARYIFNKEGALVELELTDDLLSSISVNSSSTDPYTLIMRITNPDFQSRTSGSLKISGGDFDPDIKPLIKDYPS